MPGNPLPIIVGTVDILVLVRNPRRVAATIVNVGSTAVSLALGRQATYGAGIYLVAGGGSLLIDGSNYFAGDIHAISTGAGSTLAIEEW